MGTRGPVPKRSDLRHGHRTTEDRADVTTAPARDVTIPDADPAWHPIAAQWYESLAESGQSVFYESSDWATAYLVAESMSRDLGIQVVGTTQSGEVLRDVIPLKGASLAAYLRAFATLLVTEGDRRRLRVELERGSSANPEDDRAEATVTVLRDLLTGS